ncbi:MAG: sigma-70 family RNA polymerase sigma factor [Polyangiaceae bacterium]
MRPSGSLELPWGGGSPALAPAAAEVGLGGREAAVAAPRDDVPSFPTLYDDNVDFVWRSLRRLGVSDAALDDALQEVFVVVHRRLPEFERRAAVRTWLFGICMHVARTDRRRRRRRDPPGVEIDDDVLPGPQGDGPDDRVETAQGVQLVHRLLEELDDDKRAVFVLAELEQMSTFEIAEALGVKRNTVASRLRAARLEFEQAVARHRARERWRTR